MLKLKRFNEGVWFDWPGAKGVRLKIRGIPQSAILDIRKSLKKKIAVEIPNEEKIRIIDDIDDGEFAWRIFDHALEAWEGIEIEGNPTPEEIKRAIFNHTNLMVFIGEKSKFVLESQDQSLEEELKNSEGSQGG